MKISQNGVDVSEYVVHNFTAIFSVFFDRILITSGVTPFIVILKLRLNELSHAER